MSDSVTPLASSREVSNEEIAAAFDSDANSALTRRVARAALLDIRVRRFAQALRDADAPSDLSGDSTAGSSPGTVSADRRARLQSRLLQSAVTIAQAHGAESPEAEAAAEPAGIERLLATVRSGGGLWQVGEALQQQLERLIASSQRALTTGSQAIALPCFAPAAAASEDTGVRRETVTTPEGVRLEFQQLPGDAARVRVLVDATALQTESEFPYNCAFVTLEEHPVPGDKARHILVIALNAQGRGRTDFSVVTPQNADQPDRLPLPGGTLRLIGTTLARLA